MKRVFLIHGCSGSPDGGWFSWLKKVLAEKGYTVVAPLMPNPETPKIEEWVVRLAKVVSEPDKSTYFVGHSIGCQTIIRYLETIAPQKVGGVFFVAGWFNFKQMEGVEEEMVAQSWIKTSIDFAKVKMTTKNFFALFSTNDPWVPTTDAELFQKNLGAEIFVIQNKKHFNEEEKIPLMLEWLEKSELL